MRQALQNLLAELESILPKVRGEFLERANRFNYDGGYQASTHAEAQEIITRYFWNLFCPSLPIEENWDSGNEHVWGRASNFLKSYGSPLNALAVASSGVEGGLRGVLDELLNSYVEDQCKNRVGTLVSEYWNGSTPEELVNDSTKFVREYKDVLPPDKLEHNAAYLRGRYRDTLQELPFLLDQARVR